MTGPLIWAPYCGVAPGAGEWRWNLDPVLLAVLALMTAFVVLRAHGRERVFGLAAIGVLIVGFVSPLCALSSALFSARTVYSTFAFSATAW